MLKKFTEGLVFGTGFAISYIFVSYLAAYLVIPIFAASQMEKAVNEKLSQINVRGSPTLNLRHNQLPSFMNWIWTSRSRKRLSSH